MEQSKPAGHALPHPLQFAGSDRKSTQASLQESGSGSLQEMVQVPPTQVWSAAHVWLQPLQFAASVRMSAQYGTVPLQNVKSGAQEKQVPLLQTLLSQLTLQALQCSGSV